MVVAMKPKVPMLPDITSVVPSVQISNMIYHSEQFILVVTKQSSNQWPNLKNLSGGLNLSPGLNIVDST